MRMILSVFGEGSSHCLTGRSTKVRTAQKHLNRKTKTTRKTTRRAGMKNQVKKKNRERN
jgi:hypothetical protein